VYRSGPITAYLTLSSAASKMITPLKGRDEAIRKQKRTTTSEFEKRVRRPRFESDSAELCRPAGRHVPEHSRHAISKRDRVSRRAFRGSVLDPSPGRSFVGRNTFPKTRFSIVRVFKPPKCSRTRVTGVFRNGFFF